MTKYQLDHTTTIPSASPSLALPILDAHAGSNLIVTSRLLVRLTGTRLNLSFITPMFPIKTR